MLIPLFLLIGFGAAVLYSAAGGSMQPFASSHLIRFGVFLVMASIIAMFSKGVIQFLTYPAYIAVVLLLVAVEAIGAMGGIWADKFDQLAAFQNFLIMPLTMLSGVFYSIHSLPQFWQNVSHFNPFFFNVCSPPCSRSIKTTTSVVFNPTCCNGCTVSITDIPLVTKSSTNKHVCPFSNAPSIAFFVP